MAEVDGYQRLAGRGLKMFEPRHRPIIMLAITYYRLDHPGLVQELTWTFEDDAPDYPRVQSFFEHWRKNIRSRISSIRMDSPTGHFKPIR